MQTQIQELYSEAKVRLAEAVAIAQNPEASGEDKERMTKLTAEVMDLKNRALAMSKLDQAAREIEAAVKADPPELASPPSEFKSLGTHAIAVWNARFGGRHDPRLEYWNDPSEPGSPPYAKGWLEGKGERKDLVENIGASGGFTVPLQQESTLLQVPAPAIVARPRATVVPMTRRAIQWPALDQTGTTAGQPHWFGGVLSYWTEEGEYKHEADPAFRQLNMVAHKLCNITEASDELLEDSGISIEALLTSLFTGAINWYEEEAFMNGTGAGQPQGVIWAPATIAVGRAVAGAIGLNDLVNMLEAFQGGDGIWMCNRRGLSNLMLLNGPAANPSYVFMPSARDAMPNTLFGYPLVFNEHCPALGVRGDIGLFNWRMYLVGDRKGTTIDASKHDKFRYDLTVWRAVKRVDGTPWLSAPLTESDGISQISPFVVLDAAVAT